MSSKNLIIIACCFAATLAIPLQPDEELAREKRQLQQTPTFNFQAPPQNPIPKFNFQAPPIQPTPKFNFQIPPPQANPNDKRFEITRFDGGGSRSQGFDINAAGRAKLWESPNKLNQIHGTGSYNQHFGGPNVGGGIRPNVGAGIGPNVGGGISFTRNF